MKTLTFTTCSALVALCSATAAYAQTAETAQPPEAQSTPAGTPATNAATEPQGAGLEDIIVTAQRRSERLQSVPVAVTATTALRLAATGVTSTQGLSLVTPGLSVPQTSGYTQPRIRGIGSTVNGPGFEPPVATYIDGVYVASSPAALLTLNNIARVEVLKGPQGTLFGRNATGGLVNVITKDPQQTPSADIRLTYANYQDVTADTYLTGGITDDLAIDLSARYESQNKGWGTNLFNGDDVGKLSHDLAVRTKLLFKPALGTEIRLALDYQDRLTSRFVQEPVGRFFPIPFNNPVFGGPYNLGNSRYDVNVNSSPSGKLRAGGAMLQVNQDLGGVSLQSITAYRRSSYLLIQDVDYVPAPITNLYDNATNKQFSEELQISSKSTGRLKWVAGVFYLRSNDANNPEYIDSIFLPGSVFAPFAPPSTYQPARLSVDDRQITNSIAGYAQATYEFLKDTNLTLGGRYTYEKKKLSGTQSIFAASGFPIVALPLPVPGSGISDRLSFRKFNYRIALDHKFTPDILGYVSYNTGFKSGGFNLNLPTDPPYKPENIKSVEAGVKSEFFNRRVRVNVAGYHYDYKNIQVGRYNQGNTAIYNGAKAEVYGVDLDTQFSVTRRFTLTGGFAYNHSEFKDFPNSDSFAANRPDCVPNTGTGYYTCSAKGNRLPFSPRVTVDASADYTMPLPGGSELSFNAIYFRSSRFYGHPDNVSYQSAYDLVNGAITWTDASKRLSVRVWAKNIGDTRYASSILESTAANVFNYGDPRTYGATLGFKY